MGALRKIFAKKRKPGTPAYRLEFANSLHGLAIRYVTERRDGQDEVIGRGGSLSVRGDEFLVFSSSDVIFRARVSELDASNLLSGDGVVLTAPNLEDGGKVHSVIAYFVYHRK